MPRIFASIGVFILFLLPVISHAHALKLSSSEMNLQGPTVDWAMKVHLSDFDQKFGNTPLETVKEYLPTRLGVNRGGEPCLVSALDLEKDLPHEVVTIHLNLSCPKEGEPLQVSYGLFYGDLNHKHLLKLNRAGKISSFTFSPEQTEAEFRGPSLGSLILNFLKLGLEHILTGYDHILFILSLILGARHFKILFWLVTSFTLAHSISLALAAFDIVQLSPRFVEPAIAASIAFVAIRHALAGADRDFRSDVFITFFFGLIHGLGFSSALREAQLERGNLVWPLLSFNGGVEIGQVLIVAVVFPLLQFLERVLKGSYLTLKRGALAAIAGMGIYWVVVRVWF